MKKRLVLYITPFFLSIAVGTVLSIAPKAYAAATKSGSSTNVGGLWVCDCTSGKEGCQCQILQPSL